MTYSGGIKLWEAERAQHCNEAASSSPSPHGRERNHLSDDTHTKSVLEVGRLAGRDKGSEVKAHVKNEDRRNRLLVLNWG